MKIKNRCTTGINIPISDISLYPNILKKHSMLEIQRLKDSILNDGVLFPIAIGRIDDYNYIIDGEATYSALCELENEGNELPLIPVFYVRCTAQTIKKMILIGTSTNHCVTELSLKNFESDTEKLKHYGFSSPELIDFHDSKDIAIYVDVKGGKCNKVELNEKDFEGLLK